MGRLLLRIVLIAWAFGISATGIGLIWDELRIFDARAAVREARPTAAKIEPGQLAGAAADLDAIRGGEPELLQAKLALQLKHYAAALARPGGQREAAGSLIRAGHYAKELAAAAPMNGQAWCVLADIAVKKDGFTLEADKFLTLCYRTAPREWWLLEARLPLALVLWPLLSQELKDRATQDAVLMVSEKGLGHWALERLGYIAAIVAPQRSAMIRQIINDHQPDLLAAYDRRVAMHQRR